MGLTEMAQNLWGHSNPSRQTQTEGRAKGGEGLLSRQGRDAGVAERPTPAGAPGRTAFAPTMRKGLSLATPTGKKSAKCGLAATWRDGPRVHANADGRCGEGARRDGAEVGGA